MKEQQITFEQGLKRLKEINELLDTNTDINETVELLKEGKSIEKALIEHLQTKEKEIQAIENGENLDKYTIISQTPVDKQNTTEKTTTINDYTPDF